MQGATQEFGPIGAESPSPTLQDALQSQKASTHVSAPLLCRRSKARVGTRHGLPQSDEQSQRSRGLGASQGCPTRNSPLLVKAVPLDGKTTTKPDVHPTAEGKKIFKFDSMGAWGVVGGRAGPGLGEMLVVESRRMRLLKTCTPHCQQLHPWFSS